MSTFEELSKSETYQSLRRRMAAIGKHSGSVTTNPMPSRTPRGCRIDQAIRFLSDRLSQGPVPVHELFADAGSRGIAFRTLRRAKQRLGVQAIKDGLVGGWYWHPPADDD